MVIEMQKLALVKSPTDKMNVILSSHRVVVGKQDHVLCRTQAVRWVLANFCTVIDALNREPAVQELLAEVDESNRASHNESDGATEGSKLTSIKEDGKESSIWSKRRSMPKILMDGVIPRATSDASLSGAHSPKILMDEGFERPVPVNENVGNNNETALTTDSGPKEDASNIKNNAIEVDPASVELPKSPAVEGSASISVVSEDAKEAGNADSAQERKNQVVSPSLEMSVFASEELATLPPTRKQYSADVLLPLLIFSVVKSNPPMLISNLR